MSVLLNISHTIIVDQNFGTNSFLLLISKSMHNKRSSHKRVYSLSSTLLSYKHTHLYRHIIHTVTYNNLSQFNLIHIPCNTLDIQYLIQQIEQSIINNHLSFTMCLLHVPCLLQYAAVHHGININ